MAGRGSKEKLNKKRGAEQRWRLVAWTGARTVDEHDKVTYQRRTKVFVGTSPEADAALIDWVQEVGRTGYVAEGARTLNWLIARWLADPETELERSTRHGYGLKLDAYVRRTIGTTKLADLKPDDLTRFYRGLVGKDGKSLSPNTVRQVAAIVRRALRYGVEKGHINISPAVAASRPRVEKHEVRPPSTATVRALLDAAMADDPAWGTALELAASTGLRRGELCALRRRHFIDTDPAAPQLVIEAAIGEGGGSRADMYLKRTKTSASRRLRLSQRTARLLREHLARQDVAAADVGAKLTEDCYLFSSDPGCGQPWRPGMVTLRWTRLRNSTPGAEGVRLHDLRHYSATEMGAAGIDIAVISGRLGHRDVSTTSNIYRHLRPEEDQRAAEAMERALGG